MGGQQSKVTSQDRAILEMKIQRDKLKQYQRKIGTVLERETDIARQCLAKGDKRRALLALRQKKYQQGLLEKTDEQLITLEQLTSSIEFALVEKDVVYGLQQGNKVLKDIHKELSVERVDKIMDETADALAYQEEINQMLGQRISNADEDAVLEEFARLESEFAMQFPEAPRTKLSERPEENPIEEQEEEQQPLPQESAPRRLEAQLAS